MSNQEVIGDSRLARDSLQQVLHGVLPQGHLHEGKSAGVQDFARGSQRVANIRGPVIVFLPEWRL